jgi:hypothetical protein
MPTPLNKKLPRQGLKRQAVGMFCALASRNRRSEDVRILAIVVSELKLRNVERHVFAADPVERADNATLEDRPEALNRVGVNCADNIFVRGVIDDFVLRENLIEMLVADPMIGNQEADLVRDGLAHEFGERLGADVFNHARDDVSLAADCASDDRLTRSGTARTVTAAPVVSVPRFAADESFVNLDNAAKLFKIAVRKCGSDPVAHVPSGCVTAEAHDPVNLTRAHSLLAGQHQMSDAKPVAERLIRVLENGPDQDREPITVRGALLALPMPLTRFEVIDLGIAAAWAMHAIRPAAGFQIIFAGIFVGKHRLELGDGQLMDRLRLLAASSCHRTLPMMEGYCHG